MTEKTLEDLWELIEEETFSTRGFKLMMLLGPDGLYHCGSPEVDCADNTALLRRGTFQEVDLSDKGLFCPECLKSRSFALKGEEMEVALGVEALFDLHERIKEYFQELEVEVSDKLDAFRPLLKLSARGANLKGDRLRGTFFPRIGRYETVTYPEDVLYHTWKEELTELCDQEKARILKKASDASEKGLREHYADLLSEQFGYPDAVIGQEALDDAVEKVYSDFVELLLGSDQKFLVDMNKLSQSGHSPLIDLFGVEGSNLVVLDALYAQVVRDTGVQWVPCTDASAGVIEITRVLYEKDANYRSLSEAYASALAL